MILDIEDASYLFQMVHVGISLISLVVFDIAVDAVVLGRYVVVAFDYVYVVDDMFCPV